jgi:Holliday junction DNA helicase RuvA
MSTVDAVTLRQTILQNKVGILESVPGIGRRTAERLILELKNKMEKLSFASPNLNQSSTTHAMRRAAASMGEIDGLLDDSNQLNNVVCDVRSALENLGYKDKDINPVISEIIRDTKSNENQSFQFMLKSALKSIRAAL